MIRRLGPGDFFGEIAILGRGGRRTATVVADGPTTVWVLFGTHFRELEVQRPDAALAVRAAMEHRLASDAG